MSRPRKPLISRPSALSALLLLLALILMPNAVHADLDVNAVSGVVMIDNIPAPSGTVITLKDLTNGATFTARVDGSNVPVFLRGGGMYDTGNIPSFNTGDMVRLTVSDPKIEGKVEGKLKSGTTTLNLNAWSNRRPGIHDIPSQQAFEDVPLIIDLEPYIWDPDDLVESLSLWEDSLYASIQNMVITCLYPEGILVDDITIWVSDGLESESKSFRVNIQPVNDPPEIAQLPEIILVEGTRASIVLDNYVVDPDDDDEDLIWTITGPEEVVITLDEERVAYFHTEAWTGEGIVKLRAEDPEGLFDESETGIIIERNLTRVIENLRMEMELLLQENEILLQTLAVLGVDLDTLNQTVLGLRENNTILQGQIQDLLRTKQELQSQKASLHVKLEDEIEARIELEGKIRNLTSWNSTLSSMLEEKARNITDLSEELEGLREEMTTAEEVHANSKVSFQAIISRLQDEITGLKAEIQLEREELNALEGEIVLLRVEKNDLASRLEDSESRRIYLLTAAGDLDLAIDTLLSEKAELEDQISQLEDGYDELDSALGKIRQDYKIERRTSSQGISGIEMVSLVAVMLGLVLVTIFMVDKNWRSRLIDWLKSMNPEK